MSLSLQNQNKKYKNYNSLPINLNNKELHSPISQKSLPIQYIQSRQQTSFINTESPIPPPPPRQQPLIIFDIENYNIFILLCLFDFVNKNTLVPNVKYFDEIERYKNYYFKGSNLNAKQKKYNKKFYNTIKFFYYDNSIINEIIDNIFKNNIKNNPDSINNHVLVLDEIFNFNDKINEIKKICENIKIAIDENNIRNYNFLIKNLEEYIIKINIINNFSLKENHNIMHLIYIIYKNYIISNLASNLSLNNIKKDNKDLKLIFIKKNNGKNFYYYYFKEDKWFFSNNFVDITKIGDKFDDVIAHDKQFNYDNKMYNLFYF
jgi:hypothetical protein